MQSMLFTLSAAAQINIPLLTVIVVIYLFLISYLGWRGYRATQTAADYLVAGRGVHPYIMALSYGATFISTSAIVGFGGVAGLFGLSLLWLTVFNILFGILIAFIFFGKRTRRMSHHLGAHTFSEFLGKRFQSKFIRIFSAAITLIMVVYAAAVLIGAGRHLEGIVGVSFDVALLVFVLITAGYVIAGGLKGVMYSDALQGTLMFIGMLLLLIITLSNSGGLTRAHRDLDKQYHRILSKEHLTAKMNARADKFKIKLKSGTELDLAKGYMGLLGKAKKTGRAPGAEDMRQLLLPQLENPTAPIHAADAAKFFQATRPYIMQYFIMNSLRKGGHRGWTSMPESGTPIWWLIVSTLVLGVGVGVLAQPQLSVRFMTVRSDRELNRSILVGGVFIIVMTGIAFVVGALSNDFFFGKFDGLSAIGVANGNTDSIIPLFLSSSMPPWFNYVFLLTLLSAAMSTMSSQFHTLGTAFSRDIIGASGLLKTDKPSDKQSIITAKLGIALTMLLTIILGYSLPKGFIAAATAIFFGLCASSFLPALAGALYWKRATRIGAVASMVSGFAASLFWLLLVHAGTLKKLGGTSILAGTAWADVDPLMIGLPVSLIVFVVVSLKTAPPDKEHLELCFKQ